MGYAVCLSFDDETETRVNDTWLRLAQQNIPSPLHGSTYRPHVTLGIFETTNLANFIARLVGFSDNCSPFNLTFSSVDCFIGKSTTIYAKIESSIELRRFHSETYKILADISTPSRNLYLADSWIPHCTLAWRLETNLIDQFINTCSKMPFPFEGQATKLWIFDDTKEIEVKTLILGRFIT